MSASILVVEDDKLLRSALEVMLVDESYSVEAFSNGDEAWIRLRGAEYDLLILDWQLPEMSGLEICRRYRERGGNSPILMGTGRGAIEDKEQGFNVGVDDYLTKPFDKRELLLRVKALLRRTIAPSSSILTLRNITLDTRSRKVTADGQEIELPPNEFTLLSFLMKHPDQVFSTEMLIKHCWSSDTSIGPESVYSCVRRLRRKLDSNDGKSVISSVAGGGYRLDSQ